MRRLRFLVPPGSFREGPGSRIAMPHEEARHLRVSLRARPGLVIYLFDGEGKEYRAEVVAVSVARLEVTLLDEESTPVETSLRAVALQAVSHDQSFDEAVDQMTALGVASIVPLLVERAKTGSRPPDAKRLARWQRIAHEAAKLSWRRIVPRVAEPLAVGDVPAVSSEGTLGLLLDPEAPAGSLRSLLDGAPPREVVLAIGPEGGFTLAEQDTLRGVGFVPISLGPRVLKSQHGGSAALAALLSRWGDLG